MMNETIVVDKWDRPLKIARTLAILVLIPCLLYACWVAVTFQIPEGQTIKSCIAFMQKYPGTAAQMCGAVSPIERQLQGLNITLGGPALLWEPNTSSGLPDLNDRNISGP